VGPKSQAQKNHLSVASCSRCTNGAKAGLENDYIFIILKKYNSKSIHIDHQTDPVDFIQRYFGNFFTTMTSPRIMNRRHTTHEKLTLQLKNHVYTEQNTPSKNRLM